ncbi:Uncharacterised protein [Mycobacteroides abscessus]|nr:Uncharacterised protein [Mycobacteroides abscessus]
MGRSPGKNPDSANPRTIHPSAVYPGTLIAPSRSDLESSKISVRSRSETAPRPSHRGHMPPW